MKKINKYFLVLSLPATLLGSCGTKGEVPSDKKGDSTTVVEADTVTFIVQPVEKDVYCNGTAVHGFFCEDQDNSTWAVDSVMEILLLKKQPEVVKKTNEGIEVTTKKGKQLFKNKLDPSGMSDDVEEYHVIGLVHKDEGRGMVFLKVYYYESYGYICVDLTTGQQFHTWGMPWANKDLTKVIAGNTDLVAGFTNNGLQLYVNENGTWKLKMEKVLDDWGPDDIYWTSDQKIMSKKLSLVQTDSGEVYKTDYVEVILKEEKN